MCAHWTCVYSGCAYDVRTHAHFAHIVLHTLRDPSTHTHAQAHTRSIDFIEQFYSYKSAHTHGHRHEHGRRTNKHTHTSLFIYYYNSIIRAATHTHTLAPYISTPFMRALGSDRLAHVYVYICPVPTPVDDARCCVAYTGVVWLVGFFFWCVCVCCALYYY